MATVYFEIPHNWNEIKDYVIDNPENIVSIVVRAEKLLFYDTCSFRYHANINETNRNQLLQYYFKKDIVVILTKTILMKQASYSGVLEACYIKHIKGLNASGISIIFQTYSK